MIARLDHVNLRTAQLDKMIAWYEHILQLKIGNRPGFSFPGAWMYVGELPVVHLVGVDIAPPKASDLALEHAAFSASGMMAFIERLQAAGEPLRVVRVPDVALVQVNVWDPDGNHLHIDFDAVEAEGLDIEDFNNSKIEA